jgi:hypothetical protein
MVYRPTPPALLTLNLSAWLLLETLIEQPGTDPWPRFWESVRHTASAAIASKTMQDGLQILENLQLITSAAELSATASSEGEQT